MRTRTRYAAPLLLNLLAASAVMTGCAGVTADQHPASATGDSGGKAGAEAPGDGATAEDSASDVPAFPANAEPDTAEASADASLTVRDVRLGRQDGFDRVVFEFGGTGTPGWDVRYVDVASSQGSGKVVDVAGSAVLQVSLTGIGYPYDTGVTEYSAASPLTGADTQAVTEVVYDASYEGTALAFVGTKAQAPFRAYLLDNPTRVVVEVADPS